MYIQPQNVTIGLFQWCRQTSSRHHRLVPTPIYYRCKATRFPLRTHFNSTTLRWCGVLCQIFVPASLPFPVPSYQLPSIRGKPSQLLAFLFNCLLPFPTGGIHMFMYRSCYNFLFYSLLSYTSFIDYYMRRMIPKNLTSEQDEWKQVSELMNGRMGEVNDPDVYWCSFVGVTGGFWSYIRDFSSFLSSIARRTMKYRSFRKVMLGLSTFPPRTNQVWKTGIRLAVASNISHLVDEYVERAAPQ